MVSLQSSSDAPTLSEEDALAAKLGLLEDLIIEEILLARASAQKIEVSESEVDTAFAEAKKNIADPAFQQELTRRNLTAADMRDGLRRELLTRKLLEREVSSKVTVTDQQVSDFFNANRELVEMGPTEQLLKRPQHPYTKMLMAAVPSIHPRHREDRSKSELVLRAGEVLTLPSNLPHKAEALEDTLSVDVFCPPRQDWLDGSDAYLRGR